MEGGAEMCCVCAKNGKTSKLKIYQINFEEAIRFCEDDKCTYPAGMDNLSWVLNRKFSELQVSKPSTVKAKSLLQHAHLTLIKTPNQNRVPQTTPFASKNTEPTKPALNTKQQLKTGQNSSMHISSAALSKTGQNVVAFNKSQGQFPAMQLSTGKAKPSTDTTKHQIGQFLKSLTSQNTDERIPKSLSVSAVQTVVKSETFCPDRRDQLSVFYPQWQNKDALCWMDVILCLLVHCRQINILKHNVQDTDTSIVCTLIKAYSQAVSLLNKRFVSSDSSSPSVVDIPVTMSSNTKSHVNSTPALLEDKFESGYHEEEMNGVNFNPVKNNEEVKTGAGLQLLKSDFLKLMASHSDSECSKAFDILGDIREKIWNLLHPRLRCKKGKNDSPVFAIPLLTKNSKDLEQLLNMKYSFHFNCSRCGFQDVFPYQRVLPTFPNTAKNFSMNNPKFLRPCFKCLAKGQTMSMVFERLPPVLMLHFQEGLHSNKFSGYDFHHQNQLYQVTGVIQYRNDPDHFIAWIRNPKLELWMECNDLKSPVCQFDETSPGFPASQVHIMMWEAIGPEKSNTTQAGTKNQSNKLFINSAVGKFNADPADTKIQSNESFNNSNVGKYNTMVVLGNSVLDVPMETNVLDQDNLMSFVAGNEDAVEPASGNGGTADVPAPSSFSLVPAPSTINPAPVRAFQLPIGASNMTALSDVNRTIPVNPISKIVNVENDRKQNTQTPFVIKQQQVGNVTKSSLPGDGKSCNGASKSTASAYNILNKTKNNVNMLRNMKNPRSMSVSTSEARGYPANVQCLKDQETISFLNRILGKGKEKPVVSPIVKGKVFEGYKSKSATHFTVKSRTRSETAETESVTSRPNSPALSCHSDSFVIQKRKSELVSENNRLPVLKRRRSQDTNFSSTRQPVHVKSLSLDTATSLTGHQLMSSNASTNRNMVETAELNGQCSYNNRELLSSDVRNNCIFQESDILQNLYSALNIEMPVDMDDGKPQMKTVAGQMGVENIPDISDLDNFINSSASCDTNMEDNFDDFLSEL
ncbi:SUMO-specific isopeptidase USPL1-like [Argopecten irradians]|uniref:SUMO-specific isopeptidase USPL1-like n=1 Tax=Argopecten irradians TaxID=31199 RepID=UPI0037238E72